jgi:hypothetical protein
MAEWVELIRSAVRPFIIVWGAVLYGICLIKGIPVPDLLGGLVAAFVIEYFGERAVIRFKENTSAGSTKGES